MVLLSKEDWNALNSILGKLGFGGYYDFMEVLRQTAYNLSIRIKNDERRRIWQEGIKNEKDLRTLVSLVNTLSVEKEK
jgi:hypothetical protein